MEGGIHYSEQAEIELLLNESTDIAQNNFTYDLDFINSLINDLPNIDITSEGHIAPIKVENLSPIHDNGTSSYETSSRSSNSFSEDPDLSKQALETLVLEQSSNAGKTKVACPICKEGDAGRHKHYGGSACISCRAFFRRSVQNDAYKKFKCPNLLQNTNAAVQSCDINSKSWSSCRYCRFHKCLSSGLKVSLVLKSGAKSGNQRSRNNSNRQLQSLDRNITQRMNSVSRNVLSSTGFMNQEVMLISFNVSQFQFDHLRREMTRFFVERPSNFDTLLNAYFRRQLKMGIVDIGNAQVFGKWWQELFCSYLSNCNQDHKDIDKETIEILYNFNMAAVYFIQSVISVGNAICPSPLKEILEHVYERQRYLSHFLPQLTSEEDQNYVNHIPVDNNNSYEHLITILAKHATNQNIKVKPPEKAIDYNQAYPPEMWNNETRKWEIVVRKNIHAVARWPIAIESEPENVKQKSQNDDKRRKKSSLQKHVSNSRNGPEEMRCSGTQVDYVLVYLLSLVTLYSTDTCTGIKNAGPIEHLQNRYLHLLHQYLSFRYPNDAYIRLGRGMDIVSKARECCQILQLLS